MSQNVIKATKGSGANQIETTFTQTAWNLLGKNKEGWEMVKELPSEVKAANAKAAKLLAEQEAEQKKAQADAVAFQLAETERIAKETAEAEKAKEEADRLAKEASDKESEMLLQNTDVAKGKPGPKPKV